MTVNIEYLIPKAAVIQYDGTNWADVVSTLNDDPSYDSTDLTLMSEVDGVATFTFFDGAGVQTSSISSGDYVSASGASPYPSAVSPASLENYVKLSDLL